MGNIVMLTEGLTKSVGTRMLFADVALSVDEGDKIGIIAKNGTGKSTLLRIIAGKEAPDSGTVTWRDGVVPAILEQTPAFPDPAASALEACMSADTPAARLCREYEQAQARGDRDRAAALVPEMDAAGAWDYDDRARRLLTQLGITDTSAPVAILSGGQRKRVALARVLVDEPRFLILDEPTNHLDLTTIEWLEQYLQRQRITLLMVTHDRYFLDRICSRIVEIDREQTFTYDGNYDYYLRRRAERIEAMTAELARVRNTLRRETEWMRRQPQARAGKAKYRIDAYHDLRERSRIDLREKNVDLRGGASYIGSKIFEAKGVTKCYGEKCVLRDFSYIFARYEKVGIIGDNGVGKSTFIKMLQGIVAPDSGSFDIGTTVRFGYYSQDGISLDPSKKVIDAVTEVAEEVHLADGVSYTPMQFLTHFLFSPADQQKIIGTLSGGERARLHLAEVLMRAPNFLILDEPTNDLDIITLGILEDYLRRFDGCLIVISHDRFFLDSVVDHLFVFRGDGLVADFPGTYTDYRASLAPAAAAPQGKPAGTGSPASQGKPAGTSAKGSAPAAQGKVAGTGRQCSGSGDQCKAAGNQSDSETAVQAEGSARRTSERPRRITYKERKELEQLTADIAALEAEKAALEAIFSGADPASLAKPAGASNVHDAANYPGADPAASGATAQPTASADYPTTLAAASARYPALLARLDALELRWLELSDLPD